MSERLSRERLDTIIRMIVSARGPKVADEIADHIAVLEAENERLRVVVGVARKGCQTCHVDNGHDYCTDCYHAGSGTHDALSALDEEVGA
jgi:hypothetical protein